MSRKNEIQTIEEHTMKSLKDFQKATVERIDTLFRAGQNRVLVADEVGLGKTLIARGAIAKTAKLRVEEEDDLFKVVYICSNQNIANQNIKKLNIFGVEVDRVSETRLSMQHLKIMEQEVISSKNKQFIQLIPLTPETSFRMTSGGGNVMERALMFAVLRRLPALRNYKAELETLFIYGATKAWNSWVKTCYEERVNECKKATKGVYPANVIEEIERYSQQNEVVSLLKTHLKNMRAKKPNIHSNSAMINKLRIMFAHISVGMLNPDLVIMDEFQRFKFLIQEEESETGILAKRFLRNEECRVLLLSATPYKLYSTLEEIEENLVDEHYSEFYDVMKFLFSNDKKIEEFENVWSNYSIALRELKQGDSTILLLKNQAEDAMYGGVCRTERISVMDSGDYTDDSSISKHLEINEYDIRSYLEMGNLLKSTGINVTLPIDYTKSCPYLMSFMKNYKIKEYVEKYFKAHPEEIGKAKGNMLWLDSRKINHYEPLAATNARLEELKERIFQKKSELYLWVPPSHPYYEMQGVYKDSEYFSKILVFSSWEMVPRMIGSMISYEAERRTVGKLSNQVRNEERKNANYFAPANKRFPVPRLRFNVSLGNVRGMNLFCLLYPSRTLSRMYCPIECMNRGMSLHIIEKEIEQKLHEKLKLIQNRYQKKIDTGRADERWYYMAPILMDGEFYALKWIDSLRQSKDEDDTTAEKGSKNFGQHLDKMEELITQGSCVELGKMPDDLLKTLVNMVLGSPAICIYRSNGNSMRRATELAKVFVNRFNSTEATAIVDLAYGRCKDDNAHWQNVLRYCKDGNFQAMFDEYVHLLTEGVSLSAGNDMSQEVHKTMVDALKLHAASYSVDTYVEFKNHIEGKKTKKYSLRSRFAVGFTQSDGDDAKNVDRKDSIRNAFNSPLRPFVLATTSIGQEGLDFHNYCRKIMHWNLPNNPIDLEQREGRINRYKCLAIRQDLAKRYGDIHFENDIWNEMFNEAAKQEKDSGQSELIPYWCMGKNQEVKIERIVPMYPISKDEVNYERLIKVLSLYRLTMGQARQEELLEYMFREFEDSEALKALFIDLSPYKKEQKKL